MMICVPTPYSLSQDDDEPRDVFEEIFPDTADHYSEKRLALWARFHDTGIGNCDIDYWIRCMKCKAAEIENRYRIKFRLWDEYNARLEDSQSVDLSDGSMETSAVNRTYDPPEVTVQGKVATDYLADQTQTDYNQKTFGGLESQTVRDYADAVENPFESYAREFDRLFHWGL